jgi:hypothetical protein
MQTTAEHPGVKGLTDAIEAAMSDLQILIRQRDDAANSLDVPRRREIRTQIADNEADIAELRADPSSISVWEQSPARAAECALARKEAALARSKQAEAGKLWLRLGQLVEVEATKLAAQLAVLHREAAEHTSNALKAQLSRDPARRVREMPLLGPYAAGEAACEAMAGAVLRMLDTLPGAGGRHLMPTNSGPFGGLTVESAVAQTIERFAARLGGLLGESGKS